MPAEGLSEMVVESVRVHMLSSQHVVILKELGRDRYLPIWVGPWEANAIAMKLQDLRPERPLTHDLFVATLERLGVTLRRVVVSDLADETFRARMYLEVDGRTVDVDARPSDAIALAIRGGVSIWATREVLDRAGVEPEPDSEETGGDRLAVFRDFVNSLDIDLGDSPGGGPEGRASD
ncbi:MAG: bifunctional nuclease family protein [Candidatus Limnocylindrales bacterium]